MQIKRATLLGACSFAAAGLGKMGIGTCFQFSNGRLVTYNEEVYVSVPLDIGWEGVVTAEAMVGTLRAHKDESITITETGTGLLLRGSSKLWKTGINAEMHETLEEWDIEEPEEWYEVNPQLLDAITIVQGAAASGGKALYKTRCVHCTPDYLEATDTKQYARYMLETGLSQEYLVLRESLKAIIPLGVTEFAESPAFLHFRNAAGVRVSVRAKATQYPDLSEILDGLDGHEEFILPGGLKESLEGCGVFLKGDTSDFSVRITLKPGWLYVRTESHNGFNVERQPLPEYAGDEMVFCIHPKRLESLIAYGRAVLAPWRNGAGRLVFQEEGLTYIAVVAPPSAEPEEIDSEDSEDSGEGEE